jgi:hypothetical protein
MSDLTLFEGVVCLRPHRWRSLRPMDDHLVTKLLLDDLCEVVQKTDLFCSIYL